MEDVPVPITLHDNARLILLMLSKISFIPDNGRY
jgi:hypothetical protein